MSPATALGATAATSNLTILVTRIYWLTTERTGGQTGLRCPGRPPSGCVGTVAAHGVTVDGWGRPRLTSVVPSVEPPLKSNAFPQCAHWLTGFRAAGWEPKTLAWTAAGAGRGSRASPRRFGSSRTVRRPAHCGLPRSRINHAACNTLCNMPRGIRRATCRATMPRGARRPAAESNDELKPPPHCPAPVHFATARDLGARPRRAT